MKRLLSITSLLFIVGLSACSSAPKTITIGFSGTLTGTYASVGVVELYAVQMAIEEINETGGINGHEVVLEIRDDEADPIKAVAVDNELIDMGIDIIIGHSISIVALEAVENIEDKDVLMISPSIGTESLSNIDDLFIRNVPATLYEGTEMTTSIVADNPTNVLFFYSLDNIAITSYHRIGFETVLEANGYTTDDYHTMGYNSNSEDDYSAMEDILLTEEYDAVMFVGSNNDAAPIVNFIKANDIDIDIHLSSWASTNLISRIETQDTTNIYGYFSFIELLDDTDYLSFKETFESTYEEDAQMLSANAYDVVYVLKQAIEHADSFEPNDIKEAIIEIGTFDGIAGSFTINQFGDCTKPLYRMIIQDGTYIRYSE